MKCNLMCKTVITLICFSQCVFVYADWSILASAPSHILDVESYNGALYAGGTGGRFSVSYDDGDSWTAIDTGLLSYCSIVSLCLTDSAFIVGCNGMGIWVFSDSGVWVQKKEGAVLAVIQADSYIFAGQQTDPLSGAPGGVFYSLDYGNTWSKIDSFPSNDVQSLAYSHGRLFVGGLNTTYALTVSDFSIDTLVDLYAPSCMDTDSNVVLVGSYHGLYYSDDFGMNWRHIHETVCATEIVKDDSVIYVAGWRIFCSTDTGGHWTDLTGSIPNEYLGAFGLHNGYLYTSIPSEQLRRRESPYLTGIHQGFLHSTNNIVFCPSSRMLEITTFYPALLTVRLWDIDGTNDYMIYHGTKAAGYALYPVESSSSLKVGLLEIKINDVNRIIKIGP